MLETIATTVLAKAGERAVAVLDEALRRENQKQLAKGFHSEAKFVAVESLIHGALLSHIDHIRFWCSNVRFQDMQERKTIEQIFVDVDTYLLPLRNHVDDRERGKVKPLMQQLTETNEHSVILGTAGAGKTTSLRKIASDYFKKGKVLLNHNFPLLIELRDLTKSVSASPLIDKLQEILGIKVNFTADNLTEEKIWDKLSAQEKQKREEEREYWRSLKKNIGRQVVASYIEELNALILMDGFDEVSEASVKRKILEDFIFLTQRTRKTRLILTSRSAEFNYSDGNVKHFEIAPLTLLQVEVFAERWLGSDVDARMFLDKVRRSPFADTTIRPLTIAHLCAIYERIKDIPDKPKSVYRRIVNLLLKEWDEQRSVTRTSAYAMFDVDRKEEFLSHLAFQLTTSFDTLRFDSHVLRQIFSRIHGEYGLPSNQASEVVMEIESHNGLIVRGGYDYYEFAHKSLQEFLAANYIVRLPSVGHAMDNFPAIPNEIAIATSLSSAPNAYLMEVLKAAKECNSLPETWYQTFVTRLVLEKADFIAGRTVLGTINGLATLARLPQREHLIAAVHNFFPENTWSEISRVFKAEKLGGGSLRLRCLSGDTFGLPRELTLPGWLGDLLQSKGGVKV